MLPVSLSAAFFTGNEKRSTMKVGIVAQKGNARAAFLAAELREVLQADVRVDVSTAAAIDVSGVEISRMSECDLVVSIGGDGTFLFAARGADQTPVLGVNLGEVGFLNAVSPDDALDVVAAEVERFESSGEVPAREVPRVEATGEGDWFVPPSLNEIAVQGPQRGHGHGLSVEVRVDGSLYTGGHADGVLVSTPTGSTAYNLSEGGPLVRAGVDALVVTELCGTDPMPSLVTGLDSDVEIRVNDAPYVVVSGDGRRHRVEAPETIRVAVADEPARIAGPATDFFQALAKLD